MGKGRKALGRIMAGLIGVGVWIGAGPPARPESLAEAIAFAYESNPALRSQRAALMGADETYVQARAALGPTLTLQGVAGYGQTRLGFLSPQDTSRGEVQALLAQPLYTGGRNALNAHAAEAHIAGAQQGLRAVEQDVVQAVIQAYADVLRDTDALKVQEENLQVLADEVRESEVREHDGEITRTDVAQAREQLANQEAVVFSARGQLQNSRLAYSAVVGRNPGSLEPPSDLPRLPATVDEAFQLTESNSPELLQAKFAEVESADRVRIARAANRPTVSLGVSAGYAGPIDPFALQTVQRSITGEITVTQPLFTNGLNASVIRQSLDQNTADFFGIETARRGAVRAVAVAWNQMQVSGANVGSQRRNVEAAEAAFKGMRIEQRAGQRATLDVLITQQNLVNARLLLLGAVHDRYVAEAAVLRAMGGLDAPSLVADLPRYDSAKHLRSVAGRGIVPWTTVVEKFDAMGAPGVGRRPEVRPADLQGLSQLVAGSPPAASPLATQLPLPPATKKTSGP